MNSSCHLDLFTISSRLKQDDFTGTVTFYDRCELLIIGRTFEDQHWIIIGDPESFIASRSAVLKNTHNVIMKNDVVRCYVLEGYCPRLFLSDDSANLQELLIDENGNLTFRNELKPPSVKKVFRSIILQLPGGLLFIRVFLLVLIIQAIHLVCR